jgi:hypothetical protein
MTSVSFKLRIKHDIHKEYQDQNGVQEVRKEVPQNAEHGKTKKELVSCGTVP